jgi:hypothetical protein
VLFDPNIETNGKVGVREFPPEDGFDSVSWEVILNAIPPQDLELDGVVREAPLEFCGIIAKFLGIRALSAAVPVKDHNRLPTPVQPSIGLILTKSSGPPGDKIQCLGNLLFAELREELCKHWSIRGAFAPNLEENHGGCAFEPSDDLVEGRRLGFFDARGALELVRFLREVLPPVLRRFWELIPNDCSGAHFVDLCKR